MSKPIVTAITDTRHRVASLRPSAGPGATYHSRTPRSGHPLDREQGEGLMKPVFRRRYPESSRDANFSIRRLYNLIALSQRKPVPVVLRFYMLYE
ncbi:hypothetical protein EVAR_17394_1 [Eumeta japonica]|uniref:Uncharacterized protein n=1 Tax=Eumeta variegata TaxID=151549 RepID=A0A4C1V9W4_EUMVA|nr:hypothetical protein EVAR_17394_1 [Eumeta japonica]